MSIYCDWCDCLIKGTGQTGYAIEAVPFRALNITGQRNGSAKETIVPEIHLHEHPCREAFLRAAVTLASEHVPTEEESNPDTRSLPTPEPTPKPPSPAQIELNERERRREEWCALDQAEQERRVLEVVGEDRCTNNEVYDRLVETEGPAPSHCETATVTRRMAEAGQLSRERGQWGACRLRYSRPTLSTELRQLGETLQ